MKNLPPEVERKESQPPSHHPTPTRLRKGGGNISDLEKMERQSVLQKYFGVERAKDGNSWNAVLEKKILGQFQTEREAAHAVDCELERRRVDSQYRNLTASSEILKFMLMKGDQLVQWKSYSMDLQAIITNKGKGMSENKPPSPRKKRAQSRAKRKKRTSNVHSSKYYGVSFMKDSRSPGLKKLWRAFLAGQYLGSFNSELEAAARVDRFLDNYKVDKKYRNLHASEEVLKSMKTRTFLESITDPACRTAFASILKLNPKRGKAKLKQERRGEPGEGKVKLEGEVQSPDLPPVKQEPNGSKRKFTKLEPEVEILKPEEAEPTEPPRRTRKRRRLVKRPPGVEELQMEQETRPAPSTVPTPLATVKKESKKDAHEVQKKDAPLLFAEIPSRSQTPNPPKNVPSPEIVASTLLYLPPRVAMAKKRPEDPSPDTEHSEECKLDFLPSPEGALEELAACCLPFPLPPLALPPTAAQVPKREGGQESMEEDGKSQEDILSEPQREKQEACAVTPCSKRDQSDLPSLPIIYCAHCDKVVPASVLKKNPDMYQHNCVEFSDRMVTRKIGARAGDCPLDHAVCTRLPTEEEATKFLKTTREEIKARARKNKSDFTNFSVGNSPVPQGLAMPSLERVESPLDALTLTKFKFNLVPKREIARKASPSPFFTPRLDKSKAAVGLPTPSNDKHKLPAGHPNVQKKAPRTLVSLPPNKVGRHTKVKEEPRTVQKKRRNPSFERREAPRGNLSKTLHHEAQAGEVIKKLTKTGQLSTSQKLVALGVLKNEFGFVHKAAMTYFCLTEDVGNSKRLLAELLL